MILLGFVNVFDLCPSFLQPVFWDPTHGKALFQHSENQMTISSFQEADLEYYKAHSTFIEYPNNDINVNIGSTVIFAIYIDSRVFWGDYIDIIEVVQLVINNKTYFSDYLGFYNTCLQFNDTYQKKELPSIRVENQISKKVVDCLYDFCNYINTDETRFVDLHFRNKTVPKYWTVSVVQDLVYWLSRTRVSKEYICSMLHREWGVDLSAPIMPFGNFLVETDVEQFVLDLVFPCSAENLIIIDYLQIKTGYLLIAEEFLTKTKHFVAIRNHSSRIIIHKITVLVKELLRKAVGPIQLIINNDIIAEQILKLKERNERKQRRNGFSRIKIIERPSDLRIDLTSV